MTVISVVVGALVAIATDFEKYVAAIGSDMNVEHSQKAALLRTGNVLRLTPRCQMQTDKKRS